MCILLAGAAGQVSGQKWFDKHEVPCLYGVEDKEVKIIAISREDSYTPLFSGNQVKTRKTLLWSSIIGELLNATNNDTHGHSAFVKII